VIGGGQRPAGLIEAVEHGGEQPGDLLSFERGQPVGGNGTTQQLQGLPAVGQALAQQVGGLVEVVVDELAGQRGGVGGLDRGDSRFRLIPTDGGWAPGEHGMSL
jgi:hypothetical protein